MVDLHYEQIYLKKKMSLQNLAPGSTAKVLFGFKHSFIYIVIQKSLLLGAA